MGDTVVVEEPVACSQGKLREFEQLVRQGFEDSNEGLPGRIRAAKELAFYYVANGVLTAIAALKAPGERYRADVFEKADAGVGSTEFALELGWVFVIPAHRGRRIAGNLCRPLLARVPRSCVFATTRTSNISMIRILRDLGFARVGKPYPRRNEELVLFLRSSTASRDGS